MNRLAIVGQTSTNRSGGFMGHCCFHDDRTPSLAVFPETQTFHCFGCGKGGDVITFVMELEGFSFREALWVLNQHTHAA